MLYHWYELGHAAVRPARVAADSYRMMLSHPFNPMTHTSAGRHAAAALEVFERTTRRYEKPKFGLPVTNVDGRQVAVTEEIVWASPFCNLIHFSRDIPAARSAKDPRLLLVAPMSGHYATLLRGTVETFLPDHDVYITDWKDARSVAAAEGTFDLDDYIVTMRDIFRHFHGDVHVFAVCQPSVPVLAATALMEADGEKDVPLSLILAGGPIDTRVSPTVVNKLAVERGTDWFRNNVLNSVPWPNAGAGRMVYPGFLQLSGFMTMNLDRHVTAHKDLFFHLVRGDGDSAEKHREFYDEYLAVMDLTAEFFIQTVDKVFVNHEMPCGVMRHRGKPIDLARIKRAALMTIEGEKDDITGIGQCRAAQSLCSGIPVSRKAHFECPEVGHYGVFNGSRFRREIAPRIADFARANDPRSARGTVSRPIERRAQGAAQSKAQHNPSAAAFTFAAADKKANGAHLPDTNRPVAEAALSKNAPGGLNLTDFTPFRMWQIAGSIVFDSLTQWNPAGLPAAQPAGRSAR